MPLPVSGRGYHVVQLRWIDAIDASLAAHPGLWLIAFSALYFLAAIASSQSKPLWFDEIFTFSISNQPGFSNVLAATRFDSHPPLSFLLTHISQLLFGPTDLATRLPETAGFLLVCVCLYVFVRRRSRPLFALLAATFPAFTSVFSYASEARPYALVLGLAGVALISWQATTCGRQRYLGLACLAISIAAALCCHYYALFDIAFPLALGEAARTWNRKRIDWGVWCAFALSAVPLIWLWPQASAASAVFAEHLRASPVFWAKPTPLRLFDLYSELFSHAILPGVIALGVIALAGMTRFMRAAPVSRPDPPLRPTHELAAAIGFLLVPAVVLAFTYLRTGYFMNRYALTAVLGVAILTAYLLSSACSWPVASLFILAFVCSATGLRSMNVVHLIGYLRGHAHGPAWGVPTGIDPVPGSLPVVVSNPLIYLQSAHYGEPALLKSMVYLTDVPTALQQVDPLPEYSLYEARAILPGRTEDCAAFLKQHDRFWLYYSGNPGMEWLLPKLLDAGYAVQAVKQRGIFVLFDVRKPSERLIK